ncbi:hypothetical protein L2E82_20087 [Cichorium intybus]|uniref:Uncharacterized protein n=1 Tax=Cichorium intybus TaxID=13427 RepID=A0ACB9DSC0_CICIN|nr:hypothetical protein L2E82_20087 [Cichorium intybus]
MFESVISYTCKYIGIEKYYNPLFIYSYNFFPILYVPRVVKLWETRPSTRSLVRERIASLFRVVRYKPLISRQWQRKTLLNKRQN